MGVTFKVEHADKIAEQFAKSPKITLKWLLKAQKATVGELSKNTTKATVPWDQGALAQTFEDKISRQGVSYFPTRLYAPFVYFGTSRGIKPTKYLDRILELSEKDIVKHYTVAMNEAAKEITQTLS